MQKNPENFTPFSDILFNIIWHLPQPPLSYCTSPNQHKDLVIQQTQPCDVTAAIFKDLWGLLVGGYESNLMNKSSVLFKDIPTK